MNAAPELPEPAAICTENRIAVQQRSRARTLQPVQRLTRPERRAAALVVYPEDVERPKTRADCIDGPRPCPFVSCAHHLYLEVSETGAVKVNHPYLEVEDMQESCALDVADAGGTTLERVGELLNITRSRVQQVEAYLLGHLADGLGDQRG